MNRKTAEGVVNHKFKVGDKGFTRDGELKYEVVIIDPSVRMPLIVKLTETHGNESYYACRFIDGRVSNGTYPFSGNLMPPEEYVWVNWLRHPTLGVACPAFMSEQAANEVRYEKSSWTLIKRAVKIKVPVA